MSSDIKCMHLGKITSFFIPTVTLVGEHSSRQIPERLRIIGGKKPLIVTDQGIVAVGILKQITDILDASQMPYAYMTKLCPIPPIKMPRKPLSLTKRKIATASLPWVAAAPKTAERVLAFWQAMAAKSRTMKAWTNLRSLFLHMLQ